MPRTNGSYIGIDANPTASEASGIWSVRDAERLLRSDRWPSQPGVPGAPSGTPANASVALTWGALTATPAITDYGIQYSSNSGTTWTTFSDGVGTATSATVTGLANGTSYIFRLYGINALGDGPFGSASGAVTPVSLNVATLLRFNGSNGSTTFTDSSPNGVAVTANNGAAISTVQSKFGGASGYFDGSQSLTIGTSPPFTDWNGSDWTIEMWLRPDSVTGYRGVFNSNTRLNLHLLNTGDLYLNNGVDGAGGLSASGVLQTGSWQHVAAVRSGSTSYLYVNGQQVGSANVPYGSGSGAWSLANDGTGANHYAGYIDDFRVVAGTAVYTGNFTPPTAQL